MYLQTLLKFETIITAQLLIFIAYLLIFKNTTPLSNYLQTSGMDLLQSYKMVEDKTNILKKISREFNNVYERAKHFSSAMNDNFRK